MNILNIDDIPSLLKESQLYRILTENDEQSIHIPKKYIIENSSIDSNDRLIINSVEKFFKLMEQLRYWMIDKLPYEIYDYILYQRPDTSNHSTKLKDFKDFHYDDIQVLNDCLLKFQPVFQDKKEYMFINYKGTMNKIMMNNQFLLKYLISNSDVSTPLSDSLLVSASEHNKLNILKYLYDSISNKKSTFKFHNDIPINAAKHQNFEMLKWVNDIGCEKNYGVCNELAKNGNLEMFTYAYKHGFDINEIASIHAVENNHLPILKYIMSNNDMLGTSLSTVASKTGNLEMLKFIDNNIFELPNKSIYDFANNNYSGLIPTCSTDGVMVDISTCVYTAYNKNITQGILDCLKYALDKGCRHCNTYWMEYSHSQNDYKSNIYRNTYFMAASNGHLEIIKLLHSYNRPIHKRTIVFAAMNGKQEVVHWLLNNGCEWHEKAEQFAIENGYFNCLAPGSYKIDGALMVIKMNN